MKSLQLHIFIDFDGTIAQTDIGDELFRRFGQFEPYHSQLLAGELSIREYWRTVFSTLPKGFGINELTDFLATQEVDPYFGHLIEFCRKHSFGLSVVSDGFDIYITPMLQKAGAGHLPRYTNIAEFRSDSPAILTFPGADEACTCFCASCKRNAVLKIVAPEELCVYIGDGYSDFCAARHADIIFAKKTLAAYCNENRLPHYPYKSLGDVVRILDSLLRKPAALRKRRQAELLRDAAFMTE